MNNLPKAFIERIQSQFKNDAQDFLDAIAREAHISVRLNKLKCPDIQKLDIENYIEDKVKWDNRAYYLNSRPSFTLDPLFHTGAYYVQEASSMFISHILKQVLPTRDIRILDLCAAPGGKSTLIADNITQNSLLVSNEIISARAHILKENVIKWGRDNIVVTNNSADDFSSLSHCFDVILVDAPCSGEGMFRKDRTAIDEWSEKNLEICENRQKDILSKIWNSLRPNGILIYSTCTYNFNENQNILEWILEEYHSESIYIQHDFSEISKLNSPAHCYSFYPHLSRGEGFFVGVIRKGDAETREAKLTKNKAKNKKYSKTIELPKEFTSMLGDVSKYTYYQKEDIIGIVPSNHADFIELLEHHLKILYKGCEIAELNAFKPQNVKPQHSLALWIGLQHEVCDIYDLDKQKALSFLHRDSLPSPTLPNKSSWLLIRYKGTTLGWCKNIGNRLNNYYPKEWRIRMDIN